MTHPVPTAPAASAASADDPKPRILTPRILGWAFWDWGSAAFNAVATTFVFSVYLTSDGMFTDKATATEHLSTGLTVAGVLIALLAPVTGQRADRRGRGGVWLGWFTAAVVVCLGLMFFVAPDSPLGREGALWLGIGLLGLGNVFFEFASVNYNAMLNHISTKRTMGRISGLGWGLGYVGGIVLLLILFVGFINPEVGWFGVTAQNGLNVRVSMLVAALWFGVSALPVILNPPRPAHLGHDTGRESLIDSYRKLWGTIVSLFREAPHTLSFLIASAIYRDGLAGVFTFGAIIAASVFGFSSSEVIVFAIAANVVAGLATIAFGALDDRVGPKRVIMISLVCMVAAGLGVFALSGRGPMVFWILGLILCVFVGPAQSASRSFLGRVIPEGREGEVFGLYATTGRAVSFLSPLLYGVFIRIGRAFGPEGGDPTAWGILGIIVILAAGLALLAPIRTERAHLDIYREG
ncbi:MAG: MFS transporter [Actinomyces sp.]|jgi:UMF1 family MFS transporter|nr:MFS transporter [Actinomyces sp.]MCI1642689.1 MFS transporter [Actinomyces sp.]MCI1663167.1 MFS transporter [Actinomyces sp.]MCI1692052.1 MFS transporter [Actinomyces sp.]